LILIAGKGHESHQEIAGQRIPSNDRDLAQAALHTREPHGHN
jgi:UDP-N-acetylmuramyl tripeptide synthase